jgi:hypothetical protein
MADERSYLDPEFEFDVKGKSIAQLKDSASWNWDLAKRRIKKIYNQHKADQEWKEKNPEPKKEKGLALGRTASLLEKVDD